MGTCILGDYCSVVIASLMLVNVTGLHIIGILVLHCCDCVAAYLTRLENQNLNTLNSVNLASFHYKMYVQTIIVC